MCNYHAKTQRSQQLSRGNASPTLPGMPTSGSTQNVDEMHGDWQWQTNRLPSNKELLKFLTVHVLAACIQLQPPQSRASYGTQRLYSAGRP